MKEEDKNGELCSNNDKEKEIRKWNKELKLIYKEQEYIKMKKEKLDERAKKLKEQEIKLTKKISLIQREEIHIKECENEVNNIREGEKIEKNLKEIAFLINLII